MTVTPVCFEVLGTPDVEELGNDCTKAIWWPFRQQLCKHLVPGLCCSLVLCINVRITLYNSIIITLKMMCDFIDVYLYQSVFIKQIKSLKSGTCIVQLYTKQYTQILYHMHCA